MRFLRRVFTPLFAFVGIQVAWVLVVVFWVVWFLGSHRRLREVAEAYGVKAPRTGIDWFVLVEGIVLLVAILVGVYVIFLYWRRQVALYRAQRNFISQVTHELKSPLASLQLHLETIRLRSPSPERLDGFVDTMLADADRLHGLINNLLSASRLDQRGVRLTLHPRDLSELVERYVGEQAARWEPGATLDLTVAPGLVARIETESIEMVLRNLLENAVLYSEGPPRIRVSLQPEGRVAHLTVADEGRGLERRELKRVFRMFYRVRRPAGTTRGTGLGLFIVKAIVRRHGGRVWAESTGPGYGTSFHVLLPLSTSEVSP